ncbi:MAG TPA: hypothetical protein VFQ38_16755 [Longimicrobiales bacterium]|nr:hypothetical protein [Longimicrobiales bacterium]
MPGDALHRSDDRPLPPAFTQRSSRGPEPATGEQPLMPPYYNGDRGSYTASTSSPAPASARAAVAGGAATEDWGDEPWASTPDYEDAPPPAAKQPEPAPITDFLVVEEPEPQPVEAFLEEVVDPVQALVQGVTLLDEPEAPAEPIDADTLAYVEAVALGEAASTTYAPADAEADVPALDMSLDAPASEAAWAAPLEPGHDMGEPGATESMPAALDIAAEAAEAASAASAWPAEVLAAIGAPGAERPVTPAPVDARPARPAELEPPIELQPVGFEALASEILAGAPATPVQDVPTTEPAAAAPASEPEARVAHTPPPAEPAPSAGFDAGPPSMAVTQAAAPGAVLDPAALELVERLEAAAQRLREHGAAGLAVDLLNGDRFDAMLAGVLTGFLAARRG